MEVKHWAIAVATGLVLLAAGVVAGRCSRPAATGGSVRVLARTDTMVVRTSLRIDKPVPLTSRVTDTMLVAVSDTVRLRDTVYLRIPREEKVYEGEDYRAQVSGYRPELDWIEVFPEKMVVTSNFAVTSARKRWGIGLQAGYGAYLGAGKVAFSPYIGIGISYNILSF